MDESKQVTIDDITNHFQDTIFWNWCKPINEGLDDPRRIECEWPLEVSNPQRHDEYETTRDIHFVSGECDICVATAREFSCEETAHECDATFIAKLPVYIPALLRALRESSAAHNETIRELLKIKETLKVHTYLLQQIVDDASPCTSACSRLVDEALIERAEAVLSVREAIH